MECLGGLDNSRECEYTKALKKVEKAKDVCQSWSMWRDVVSSYPEGKKVDFINICMYM